MTNPNEEQRNSQAEGAKANFQHFLGLASLAAMVFIGSMLNDGSWSPGVVIYLLVGLVVDLNVYGKLRVQSFKTIILWLPRGLWMYWALLRNLAGHPFAVAEGFHLFFPDRRYRHRT